MTCFGAMTQADLGSLGTASAEEATAFFASVAPETLVEAVRRTSDAELLELLARDEVRPAAVAGILTRLHEYAIADRLADLHGVVRFDLERRGTLLERQGLAFDNGAMRPLPVLSDTTPVDVVLRTSLLRFVRVHHPR